ncbi:DUF350 domain-containing protein [Ferrimonas senticii]|uniref:DUF350 domain-containing protein n=1 Tax=Ferrimonas senticii TaxID=394566 RepID=UPI00041B48F9|nr:DUF350 domain-containing protein [Ferrimonas senticii]
MDNIELLTHWPLQPQQALQLVDLLLVVLLFLAARYSHGWFSGVDSTKELAERDNVAFGISVAGGIIALAITISGVFLQPASADLLWHSARLLALGLGSLLLIRLGRICFDKWGMDRFDKRELILEGNVPVAIVDAAVACAIAFMLKGAMQWFGRLYWGTIPMLVVNFIGAMALLILISRFLERRYAKFNQGGSLQQALVHGHMPVAIRHSGYLLACGLIMLASGQSEQLQADTPVFNMALWFAISFGKLLLLMLLSTLLRRVVLAQVKVSDEIERQNNGGVAALEAALIFAAAYLLNHVI